MLEMRTVTAPPRLASPPPWLEMPEAWFRKSELPVIVAVPLVTARAPPEEFNPLVPFWAISELMIVNVPPLSWMPPPTDWLPNVLFKLTVESSMVNCELAM